MTAKPVNNITDIGSGAWGTALAEAAARAGRSVTIYARDALLAASINQTHENMKYLPGAKLNAGIRAVDDMAASVVDADMVLFVTPAQHMRTAMTAFKPHLPAAVPVLCSSKGIEIATGSLMSEVAAEVLPAHAYGVLSGPTFATETVRGLPTALTLATTHPQDIAANWARALHAPFFRPYLSDDPVGAEIAGAVKNVIAIACGIVEGLKLGQNTRAAVMTRGMAEIKRFGLARGAKPDTFLGLAGLGDLVLTCNSMTSRNSSLGVALGQGQSLSDIMAARNSVAEGVPTAKAVAGQSARLGIQTPICNAVDHVLHQSAKPEDMMRDLLSRDLKNEVD